MRVEDKFWAPRIQTNRTVTLETVWQPIVLLAETKLEDAFEGELLNGAAACSVAGRCASPQSPGRIG